LKTKYDVIARSSPLAVEAAAPFCRGIGLYISGIAASRGSGRVLFQGDLARVIRENLSDANQTWRPGSTNKYVYRIAATRASHMPVVENTASHSL
jgi:hypothetical protein